MSWDPGDLGAHALGLLDGPEARALEQHLAGCAACRREFAELRRTAAALGTVPPEAFLDGPASDLVVARAVRRVRAESGAARRRRGLALAAAAVVMAVALLGGGVLLGRSLPDGVAEGTRTLAAQQGTVALSAAVEPANGWVRVAATVRGIPAGKRCTIVVIGADGTENVAGSWLSGAAAVQRPATIDGSAIVDPAEVIGVAIRDETGTDLVIARA
jgi:anti-sigma factor RsiW